jgi:hypothetical protein
MLNAILKTVVILSVNTPSIIMLTVIVLNVIE